MYRAEKKKKKPEEDKSLGITEYHCGITRDRSLGRKVISPYPGHWAN